MRVIPSICLMLVPVSLWAQPDSRSDRQPGRSLPEPVAASEPVNPRHNQKIERIRVEDGGARIDELRVGGQTQSITVQPKANVPEYEFQPTDLSRSRPVENRDGTPSAASPRVWNLFKF